jgi:hypothetical protein
MKLDVLKSKKQHVVLFFAIVTCLLFALNAYGTVAITPLSDGDRCIPAGSSVTFMATPPE